MALRTEDFTKVLLDQTLLIVELEKELNRAQEAWRTEVAQLHQQYGQKLENLKDKMGDREGSSDVQPGT